MVTLVGEKKLSPTFTFVIVRADAEGAQLQVQAARPNRNDSSSHRQNFISFIVHASPRVVNGLFQQCVSQTRTLSRLALTASPESPSRRPALLGATGSL